MSEMKMNEFKVRYHTASRAGTRVVWARDEADACIRVAASVARSFGIELADVHVGMEPKPTGAGEYRVRYHTTTAKGKIPRAGTKIIKTDGEVNARNRATAQVAAEYGRELSEVVIDHIEPLPKLTYAELVASLNKQAKGADKEMSFTLDDLVAGMKV